VHRGRSLDESLQYVICTLVALRASHPGTENPHEIRLGPHLTFRKYTSHELALAKVVLLSQLALALKLKLTYLMCN